MQRRGLRTFITYTLTLFILLGSINGQPRKTTSESFIDHFFLVSNYSDLNNSLEKETLTIAELLSTSVRGFQLRLTVDADSAIVKMATPNKDKVSFSWFLNEINQFLDQNPDELIVLFLAYNFPFYYLETALKSNQLFNRIYTEESDGLWPSVSQMTKNGHQLVCFNMQQNQDSPPGFYYLWDYAVEPHFSTVVDPEFHGNYNRGKANNPFMYFTGYNLPRDTTGIEIPFERLNLNENPFLISHLINLWRKTGKRPNFIVRNLYHPVIEGIILNLESHNTISGNITYNLQPLSMVSWEGNNQALTSGHYSFPFLAGEDLLFQPFKPGYRFVPENTKLTDARADYIQNFVAHPLEINYRMQAYYPFEHNIKDKSSNRNHGKNNGVRYAEDQVRGTVAYFSDNAFIELPDAEKIGLHNNDFTVSAWIKTISPEIDRRDLTILGTEEVIYRQGLHLQLRDARPYFGFYANDIAGKTEIRHNEWVHVVWRYTKRTGEQAIFVNGKQNVVSQKHPTFMGRGNLYIGKAIQMDNYMNGYLDELVIWDRPLGDEEIWKLYQDVIHLAQPTPTQWRSLIIVLFLLSLILFLVLRKRKKKSLKQEKRESQLPHQLVHDSKKENCIRLFGEFQVINRDGEDISIQFTPKIRQLLVLLILYSQKPKRGISSDDINQCLWHGHSRKKATNNRGVTMSKLRQVLQQIDGIKIENQMENWVVEINKDQLFCDYAEAVKLLKNKKEINHAERFHYFFSIVERGTLLMDMEEEWLDNFKGHISSEIIDILVKHAKNPILNENTDFIIQICDRVFMSDPFNEDALQLKVSALVKQDHYNQAKYTYQWFAENYKKSIGSNFDRKFEDFVVNQSE